MSGGIQAIGNLQGKVDATNALVVALGGAQVVAFASLPAVPVEGMIYAVSNSNTAVWGATISGTGTDHVLAYFNGTNWTVAAK